MSKNLLLLCIFSLCIASFEAAAAPNDLSDVYEAKGTAVVKAAVARLKESGIFSDDHDFLRRVAWTNSKDGTDTDTYRDNYHGGIWQVDSVSFVDTQTRNIAKTRLHPKIKEKLGIDWAAVSWPELRTPFYSLLAARIQLFITTVPPLCTRPLPADLENQSQHWKFCYNTPDGQSLAQKFRDAVKKIPK